MSGAAAPNAIGGRKPESFRRNARMACVSWFLAAAAAPSLEVAGLPRLWPALTLVGVVVTIGVTARRLARRGVTGRTLAGVIAGRAASVVVTWPLLTVVLAVPFTFYYYGVLSVFHVAHET
jgi:predicted MFS family arabinose efflux permease